MVEQVSLIIAHTSIDVLTHQTVKYFLIKIAGVLEESPAAWQSPQQKIQEAHARHSCAA